MNLDTNLLLKKPQTKIEQRCWKSSFLWTIGHLNCYCEEQIAMALQCHIHAERKVTLPQRNLSHNSILPHILLITEMLHQSHHWNLFLYLCILTRTHTNWNPLPSWIYMGSDRQHRRLFHTLHTSTCIYTAWHVKTKHKPYTPDACLCFSH